VCVAGFLGGTSCLYLNAISSRPKVGVYIPVTLKFWPGGVGTIRGREQLFFGGGGTVAYTYTL